MPKARRQACESEIYHLTARGVGRMNIFEDDDDRLEFLRILEAAFRDKNIEVYAWCLMSNHVHLLAHAPLEGISAAMKNALGSYARFFNRKHDHVGHLFQGRFASVPVLNDAQLMETVRYIHQNPSAAGICECKEYPWSSYGAYAEDEARSGTTSPLPCATEPVLMVFGSGGAFAEFHREEGEVDLAKAAKLVSGMLSEAAARDRAERLLGPERLAGLAALEKAERDPGLCLLKESGLSIRQIERITGIGRNIIQRARRG